MSAPTPESALLAWSVAQTEMTRLRRARAAATHACENWSPAEPPDFNGYPGCAEYPACWHTRGVEPRPRADWCPSCLAAAPDLDALPVARKRLHTARSGALRVGHRLARGAK